MKPFLLLITLLIIPITAFCQRLPRSVFPVHYDLTFTPHLSEETFDGDESIVVTVQQPTREITLNALEIEFKDVLIESESREAKQRAQVKPDPEKEFVTLSFAQPVPPGPATIHIKYTGKLNHELRGFYIGKAAAAKSALSGVPAKY